MNIYEGAAGIEDIVSEVLDYGVEIPNSRTNTSTRAIFDAKIIIYEGDFPFTNNLLASPRLAFEELWFFLNGRTQTKELEEKGVNFWKGNTSKEFQESVGLGHLQDRQTLGTDAAENAEKINSYESMLEELDNEHL